MAGLKRGAMRKIATLTMAGLLMAAVGAWGQKPPLLAEKEVAAIAGEISGAMAKRNLEGIAAIHRQRGSQGFHAAAELVAGKLKEYGLSDVEILQFPADGAVMYGTQRSRPAWDAREGELRLLQSEAYEGCAGERATGSGAGSGGGTVWSGGNRELRAEPEDGVVGRESGCDSVGASGDVFDEQDICVHGVAENSARISGAPGEGRQDRAACGGESGTAPGELRGGDGDDSW